MATLIAHRPPAQRSLLDPPEEAVRPAPRPPAPQAPRPSRATLDDLVTGAWDALSVAHAAACPVCGGDLAPRYGAGPKPVAAACGDCGSRLS
jgi:hypothetical protein